MEERINKNLLKSGIFDARLTCNHLWYEKYAQDASKTLRKGAKGLQEVPRRPQKADQRPPEGLRMLDFRAPA